MCTLIYLIIFNWTFLFSSPLETLTRVSQFSHSVVSDSFLSHGLQHARLPCLSLSPRVYSNSCPLNWWCHPTISPSVTPFFSCPQSFPASGSFPLSQLFSSGGQNIGDSASALVLPMNIEGWFQKHQFFGTQPSLWSNCYICTCLLEKPWLWLYGSLLGQSDVSALWNTV